MGGRRKGRPQRIAVVLGDLRGANAPSVATGTRDGGCSATPNRNISRCRSDLARRGGNCIVRVGEHSGTVEYLRFIDSRARARLMRRDSGYCQAAFAIHEGTQWLR